MKLLLISDTHSKTSLANFWHEQLVASNHDVRGFYIYPSNPRVAAISFRSLLLFPNLIFLLIARFFIENRHFSPDITLLFQPEGISSHLAKYVRKFHPFTRIIYIQSDNVLIKNRKTFEDLRNLFSVRDITKVVFSADHVALFKHIFTCDNILKIKFGYSPKVYFPLLNLANFRCQDLHYVGTYSPFIHRELWYLSKDYKISVHGNGWDSKNCGKFVIDRVVGQDLRYIITPGTLVVNYFKPEHCAGASMKIYELTALGAVLFNSYSEDCAKDFTHGKEIFLFESRKELLSLLKSTATNPLKRERTASAAIAKSKNFSIETNFASIGIV